MSVFESTRAHSPGFGPSRLLPEGSMLLLSAGALGLFMGLASALRPEFAVAGAVALVLTPLIFANAAAGLGALLFLSFLDKISGATGAISLTKIVGILLIVGWIGSAAASDRFERARAGLLGREPALATALFVFTAWAAVSLVWAESPASGAGSLSRFVLNFTLFPIALAAVSKRRHIVWLFAVFITGALAAMAIGLPSGSLTATGTDARLEGAGLNPNQIGMLLMVAIVLSFALAANRGWPTGARLAAVAAAVAAAIGLFMTLSRGALVGLGAAMLVAPFAVGRGRRAITFALAVATIVGTVGWFTAIAPQSAVDRITHPGREGGAGREELWRVGWRMVNAHPVQGVGAGNFPVSSIHYVLRPGSTKQDYHIVDLRQVPHNVYLNVLSELGIVGLSLFLAIIALALSCVVRAIRAFARRGDETMELLSRGLLIALFGYLTSLFFSSQLYGKHVWLLLALGPALSAIAERDARRRDATVASLRPREEPGPAPGLPVLGQG